MKAALTFEQRHLSKAQPVRGKDIALILQEATHDPDLLCTAILYHISSNPKRETLFEKAPLNAKQKTLLHHLNEPLALRNGSSSFRKTVNAITQDAYLLPLRLAHRLAVMRHADVLPPTERRALAEETLYVYSTLAGRLGIYRWRSEMEERSFPLVHASIARQLQRRFQMAKPKDTVCLRHASAFIGMKLRKASIAHSIESRIKGTYSTYQKMKSTHVAFHELHDRLALRVIVETMEDCYRALGIIHAYMHPVTGTLKDYIGTPKENGYQSIHTVVYPLPGVTEQKMEIQIRTYEIHEECEFGPAVHSGYKQGTYARRPRLSTSQLLHNIRSLDENGRAPRDFERTLQSYYREHHIVVFDAENRLFHLLKPATALDFICFAYGKRCRKTKFVRINGVRQPLSSPLSDGDIVEATFGKHSLVRKDWLSHCKHLITQDFIHTLFRS